MRLHLHTTGGAVPSARETARCAPERTFRPGYRKPQFPPIGSWREPNHALLDRQAETLPQWVWYPRNSTPPATTRATGRRAGR